MSKITQVVPANWPELIDKTADRIAERLPALTDQIHNVSEAVWPILTRQAVIEAVTDACILAGAGAMVLVVVFMALRVARKVDSYDRQFAYGMTTLFGGFASLIWFLIVCAEGSRIVSAILNPQFAAAMKAMEVLN